VSQLVGGLGTGLHRASPGQSNQPEGLHGPIGGLRLHGRVARKHRQGGVDRVDGVVLAEPSPALAVRTADLDDGDAAVAKTPADPRTIRTGPLDADSEQGPNDLSQRMSST